MLPNSGSFGHLIAAPRLDVAENWLHILNTSEKVLKLCAVIGTCMETAMEDDGYK